MLDVVRRLFIVLFGQGNLLHGNFESEHPGLINRRAQRTEFEPAIENAQ